MDLMAVAGDMTEERTAADGVTEDLAVEDSVEAAAADEEREEDFKRRSLDG